ncbi:HNH endonuclease [Pseudarthrobacter chlorophenolicus]|uniref:HNH endonuclease n=1 Tax=Pseudarthrobacter chlorophenolicus TaxID=85085 RepID=UPI0009E43671
MVSGLIFSWRIWPYFRLASTLVASLGELSGGSENPSRLVRTTSRIVRDHRVAEEVKRLYADTCQVCATQIRTSAGTYSEAAHIRPLGAPHYGPDIPSNVLCLCPNCHKQFDGHALTIAADGTVYVFHRCIGALNVHRRHRIDKEHLAYHRASSEPQS